uniref:C2H2-type domain-containing protein n=1 Tax=Nothobranchius furzeri TaxID=105023 RepID=A0A8C6NIT8_NOTFU
KRAFRSLSCPKLPQHHVWEKEVLTDQQLSIKEIPFRLDQKEPESPLIKEEQQELCIHQHEGQFILKQEHFTFMVTPEETDCCEPIAKRNQPLCQSSTEPDYQDQDGSRNENSEPNRNEELTQNKRLQQAKDHRDHVDSQKIKNPRRAHRDDRQFSCKLCLKSFSYKFALTRHIKTHTGEKPFRCETCGKCSTNRSDLKKHIRTHTGEKPYQCKTCDKCFSDSSHLTTHMRTHTGEKPFKCETCGKCFSDSSHLTKHTRTHTGEKPYKCVTCGKCFGDSSHLTKHKRTQHRGHLHFGADTCKCYTDNGNLTKHSIIHTGQKPFRCVTCYKYFSWNGPHHQMNPISYFRSESLWLPAILSISTVFLKSRRTFCSMFV